MNKVTLMGRVGRDPEFKTLQGGMALCRITVATTSWWKDKKADKFVEDTQWHNVTAWNKLAEKIDKQVMKGSRVLVEGEIKYREYEKDGVKKKATEIIANSIEVIDKKDAKPKQQIESADYIPGGDMIPPDAGAYDDLPF
jgi:single-strand DNA-binding protein